MISGEKKMKKNTIIENGVVVGNFYPKYSTQNLIARRLVQNFLRTVDDFVTWVNPMDIHEVGCGEGHLISRYAIPKRKLIASDFSEQIIDIAKILSSQRKLPIEFKTKSIYSVVPEEDSASLVLCCEVFEHLENPENALAALAKIASPYLIASVPREPIWRMLNMLRGKYWADLGNTPGHLQHWSTNSFLNFLGTRFDVLRVMKPLPWTVILAKKK